MNENKWIWARERFLCKNHSWTRCYARAKGFLFVKTDRIITPNKITARRYANRHLTIRRRSSHFCARNAPWHPRFVFSFLFVAQELLHLQLVTCTKYTSHLVFRYWYKCKYMHIFNHTYHARWGLHIGFNRIFPIHSEQYPITHCYAQNRMRSGWHCRFK